jgi:hypothetical protein
MDDALDDDFGAVGQMFVWKSARPLIERAAPLLCAA